MRAKKQIRFTDAGSRDCAGEEGECHPRAVAAALLATRNASRSETATRTASHDRAATARAGTGGATKTVIAGHDLAIFE